MKIISMAMISAGAILYLFRWDDIIGAIMGIGMMFAGYVIIDLREEER